MDLKNRETQILLGVIFILFVVVININFNSNSNTNSNAVTGQVIENVAVQVNTPEKTCRDVQIPYDVEEAYIEQEPYNAFESEEVKLKYQIISTDSITVIDGFNYLTKLTVDVKNIDSETGTEFQLTGTFKSEYTEGYSRTSSSYIMSGETKTFDFFYDSVSGENVKTTYNVVPGTKTITKQATKFRDVTKFRTVTKYRTEEQCS